MEEAAGSLVSVRPGVRLNGIYQIDRLIAQGGMGEVYKGSNVETGDPVAIKMIRQELSENQNAMALFRREASTLHNVQHEAIVRYYVFSVERTLNRAYLAMEYVDGPSLSKYLERGPLTLFEVDLIRKRIGPALDAVHKLGIVHRDISSDNFILRDADVGKIKLIDFGIARSRRADGETIIGDGFAGKYNYVSPEQLGGGEVTYKSDIYSFGLVLAEALRGRPIDMGGSQVDLVEKRRTVPDLSGIPAAIRPLLAAMLQPDPQLRPKSMGDVAEWKLADHPAEVSTTRVGESSAGVRDDNLEPGRLGAKRLRVKPERPPPISIVTPKPGTARPGGQNAIAGVADDPLKRRASDKAGPEEPKPPLPLKPKPPVAIVPPKPVVRPLSRPSEPARRPTYIESKPASYFWKFFLNAALVVAVCALLAALGAGSLTSIHIATLALLLTGVVAVSSVRTDQTAGAIVSYFVIGFFGLIVGACLSLADREPLSKLVDYEKAGLSLTIVFGFALQSISLLVQFVTSEVLRPRARPK